MQLFSFLDNAATAKALQLCLTLCNPMDWSPPGSSIHEIFQARVLEWGAIAFSSAQRILLKKILNYSGKYCGSERRYQLGRCELWGLHETTVESLKASKLQDIQSFHEWNGSTHCLKSLCK